MGKIPTPLMGRYELGDLLGKGSFAKVYRAVNVETREAVAIKIMDKGHLAKFGGAVQRQVMREIDIMRRVRHPNVVRIHEVMATKRSIFVVMEYVGGGSLDMAGEVLQVLGIYLGERGRTEPPERATAKAALPSS